MKRVGYFDADGHCLMIIHGEGEPPPGLAYAEVKEVPAGVLPSTIKLAGGKIKTKERHIKSPPRSRPSLEERFAAVEARLTALEGK